MYRIHFISVDTVLIVAVTPVDPGGGGRESGTPSPEELRIVSLASFLNMFIFVLVPPHPPGGPRGGSGLQFPNVHRLWCADSGPYPEGVFQN
jgi:hypothetical protein